MVSRRNGLLPFLAILAAVLSVTATQVMHRPAGYKKAPRTFQPETNPNVTVVEKRAVNGKVNMAYFTNWGIYSGYNFQPTDIDPSKLTHLLYSFADTNADGGIFLTDSYADVEKRFPTDSWNDVGTNVYGCIKQLYLHKIKNRHLKVLLSIGGWTYSQNGHFNFVTNPTARANFVSTAVRILEDHGFDGIDIDYEYPSNSAQGQGFADLLTALRTALDNHAKSKGESPYIISAAVAAGPNNYANLNVRQMNAALDLWNLMAYDYAGSWLTYADHQANLYGGARTGINTENAINWYVANGATASKIGLGIPMYGRAFENTAGIGQPYTGIGPGTVEAGVYSYKYLPIAGSSVIEDTSEVASYSYDGAKRELVSYDTPNIVRRKAQYVNTRGLSGTFFWELSTDKKGSESLVLTSAGVLGGLDSTPNHLKYPGSKYDNIKNNMGGGGSDPPTPPGSGTCTGIAAWSSAAVYTGGMQATYNGRLWTAKWWTQNEVPGGASGVWTDVRAC